MLKQGYCSFIENIIPSVRYFKTYRKACFAFNMSANAACSSFSENSITFPMSKLCTVIGSVGAIVNGYGVLHLASLIVGSSLAVFYSFKTKTKP